METSLTTYLFYSVGIIFIFIEMLRIAGVSLSKAVTEQTKKMQAETERNKQINEAEEGDELYLATPQFAEAGIGLLLIIFVMFVVISYLVWSVLGLMSSQWFFFLALLILSLFHNVLSTLLKGKTRALEAVARIDSFISLVLIVALIVNRFHIGWVPSWLN